MILLQRLQKHIRLNPLIDILNLKPVKSFSSGIISINPESSDLIDRLSSGQVVEISGKLKLENGYNGWSNITPQGINKKQRYCRIKCSVYLISILPKYQPDHSYNGKMVVAQGYLRKEERLWIDLTDIREVE